MRRWATLVAVSGLALACGGGGGKSGSGGGGVAGAGSGGTAGAASGGAAGAGGSTTGGTGGTSASCPSGCSLGLTCCDGQCVNPGNDIENCGSCGTTCGGQHPYCGGGKCGTPPCSGASCSGTAFCCGSQCCGSGQLCCDVELGGPTGGPTCVTPTAGGTCPTGCPSCACNSPDTSIATPTGERPIAELRRGDLVLSVHRGEVRTVPVVALQRVTAKNHHVVELRLQSGATLRISPRHPTADGRTIGELRPGDFLDGLRVESARLVPYAHDATYDLLPASDSGTYFAAGVLLGSTLSQPRPSESVVLPAASR